MIFCSKPLVTSETEKDESSNNDKDDKSAAAQETKPKAEIDLRFRDSGNSRAPTAPLSALAGDHDFIVVRIDAMQALPLCTELNYVVIDGMWRYYYTVLVRTVFVKRGQR